MINSEVVEDSDNGVDSIASERKRLLSQPLLPGDEVVHSSYSSPLVIDAVPEQKPLRGAIFVVMPVFMAYACLFSLQRRVLTFFTFGPKDTEFQTYQFAISWLYIGNLVMRLGHNIVLAFVEPRWRVVISIGSMFLSMMSLCFFTATSAVGSLGMGSLWVVFLTYFFGGFGIGSFEANILNVLVVLGHPTKQWAIYGMPMGVVCITVGGFLVLDIDDDNVWPIYAFVSVCLILGFLVYEFHILRQESVALHVSTSVNEDDPQLENRHSDLKSFIGDMKQIRHWIKPITWHLICMAINMFAVSIEVPLGEYLFPAHLIIMAATFALPHDVFMAVFNSFFAFGDTISRKLFYPKGTRRLGVFCRPLHPIIFNCMTILGFIGIIIRVPLIAPLGCFFIAMGNGGIYANTVYHIDQKIDRKYNLTALSCWLFLGDCGSVIGTNLIKVLINKT